MKCKRGVNHMPMLYSNVMQEQEMRRCRKLFHQRYETGSHVVCIFRPHQARDKLSFRAWRKWGNGDWGDFV